MDYLAAAVHRTLILWRLEFLVLDAWRLVRPGARHHLRVSILSSTASTPCWECLGTISGKPDSTPKVLPETSMTWSTPYVQSTTRQYPWSAFDLLQSLARLHLPIQVQVRMLGMTPVFSPAHPLTFQLTALDIATYFHNLQTTCTSSA